MSRLACPSCDLQGDDLVVQRRTTVIAYETVRCALVEDRIGVHEVELTEADDLEVAEADHDSAMFACEDCGYETDDLDNYIADDQEDDPC